MAYMRIGVHPEVTFWSLSLLWSGKGTELSGISLQEPLINSHLFLEAMAEDGRGRGIWLEAPCPLPPPLLAGLTGAAEAREEKGLSYHDCIERVLPSSLLSGPSSLVPAFKLDG